MIIIRKSACLSPTYRQERYRPSVLRLADLPVWVLRAPDRRPVNCVLIEGPRGLIVVNTGMNLRHGHAIAKMIRTLSPKPVNTIVYPHHHDTHCKGTPMITSPANAENGTVVILAAEEWAGERSDPHGLSGSAGPTTVVPPNLFVGKECVLELAGSAVHVLPARSDSVGGINIYLPEHGVALIADDPSMWMPRVDGRAAPMAQVVDRLLSLPVKHLAGSHMPPLSGPEVRDVLAIYRESVRLCVRS